MIQKILAENAAPDAELLPDAAGSDAAAPAAEEIVRGGKEGARAFAQRLNAAKGKWEAEVREKLFEELGLKHPQTGERISDAATMKNALQEAFTQQQRLLGDADDREKEIALLRSQLCADQDRQDEAELRKHPVFGAYFGRFGGEAEQVMRYARENGKPLSLEAAFQAVLLENLGDLLQTEREKSRTEAMRSIEENRAASPAALGGEISENRVRYDTMPDAEFERVLRRALNGELKRS